MKNNMDVFDKILKDHSWRFKKGYPDVKNKEDKTLLESIINGYLTEAEEEVNINIDDKEVLDVKGGEAKDPSGGSPVYNDSIRLAIYGKDYQGKPIPRPNKKYPYQQNTFSFSVDPSDMEMFKLLFPVKPPKAGKEVGSAGSLGVGNGEIALYWLYQFSDSAKVTEGRAGDDPDLFFNDQGVEVKSWTTNAGLKKLGRFGQDKVNLSLLSVIFGFNALSEVFGDIDDDLPKTVNPTNFNGQQLITAMRKLIEFKNVVEDNNDLVSTYPLFKNIKENVDRVYRQLGVGKDSSPEDLATEMAIKLLEPKLNRKPGDGNHLANVMEDGKIKFFQVVFEKMKDSDSLLSDFKVVQSAISVNFDKIWGE
tara:strand:+ start:2001 stop:3092 length:1092 start_codon:yes stop_codon:yes gene_type:complete